MEENKIPKEDVTPKHENQPEINAAEEPKAAQPEINGGKMSPKTIGLIVAGGIILLGSLIAIMICLSAGNGDSPFHVHFFGGWETTLAPTCSDEGQKERSCICGEVEVASIPAGGEHQLVGWAIGAPATESQNGEIYSVCANCDGRIDPRPIVYDKADHLTYKVNDDGISCTVTGFVSGKKQSALVIPDNADGYIVTNVSGFSYDSSITSVTLPYTLIKIGGGAFSFCDGITEINIPEGVASIGGNAFHNCNNLKSVSIPKSVVSMGEGAFNGCDSLESVRFAEGSKLEKIDLYAFIYTKTLTYCNIPSSIISATGVTDIYDITKCSPLVKEYDNAYYFGNENNPYLVLVAAKSEEITSCTVHQDTRIIGDYAFFGCKSLKNVTFKKGSKLHTVGYAAFDYTSSLKEITLPSGVKRVESSAFMWSGLTSVDLGKSLTFLGDEAFSGCSYLKSIHIPAGVIEIGYQTFYDCDELETLTFADGSKLTSIGISAFEGCKMLKEIRIPDSVSTIGSRAFNYCKQAISINIPTGVTEIGESTFSGCDALKNVIIPDSVTSIGDYAFYGCYDLQSVVIPTSITQCGYSVFDSPDHIYFKGSEEEWADMLKLLYGSYLAKTHIHYNYQGE